MLEHDATSDFAILGLTFQNIEFMQGAELDKLPFGAIQLDSEGRVKKFNLYESTLARMPQKDVLGKDFFREVAPCADVKEFAGRFREGVREKHLHAKFNYHFAFKQDPRDVSITLFYSDITDSVWVFVQPINEAPIVAA